MAGRSRKYGKKNKRIRYKRTRKLGYKRTRKGQTKRMAKRRGKRTHRGGNWSNIKGKWISEKQQQQKLLNAIKKEGFDINLHAYDEIMNKLEDNIDRDIILSNLHKTAKEYHDTGLIMPFINELNFVSTQAKNNIPILNKIPIYGPGPEYDELSTHPTSYSVARFPNPEYSVGKQQNGDENDA